MPEGRLHVTIRTPHQIVCEQDFISVRVPTATGHVGLRPKSEATLLAVEPGLILLKGETSTVYAVTAGGLLRTDGASVVLLAPLAVTGVDRASLIAELDGALATPTEEMAVRGLLERLETDVLSEIQRNRRPRSELKAS